MHQKEYSMEIGDRTLTAIFSDLAEQAHGSVLLKYGETVVLATACMSEEKSEGLDFFNLTVDYVEKFYAAGKILGSRYNRREGRPSEEAILGSRVIDRTIRPLFDQKIKNAVQVIVTVLACDGDDPSVLAVNAASLALSVSNIPWAGPVGAIRIGKYGTDLVVNPNLKIRADQNFDYDLIVCGKDGNINMIEALSFQRPENEIEEGFKKASEQITLLENFQKQIIKEIGKIKREMPGAQIAEDALKLFNENFDSQMKETVFSGKAGNEKIHETKHAWKDLYKAKFPELTDYSPFEDVFEEKINTEIHRGAVKDNARADGRKMDDLREIYAKAGGVSSVLHGTGTFYRGGTHVLSILTLGGPEEMYLINGMEAELKKRFFHHYNFPPYSSGEVGRTGNTSRREIGHGMLAEKALLSVIPDKETFPYTMRVVSESTASNGSTSQASICAGCIALMDGGVPIKAPVAGIAMGLMYENDDNYKILTDIQGPEDHYGDMDFKVAGTVNGISAIQLDVKVEGIPLKILNEAMAQAEKARLEILEVMTKEIANPRPNISPNAPKILTMQVRINQIGLVIGPGGKTINGIKDKTGAEITIEDDGTVFVTGKNGSAEKALEILKDLTHEYTIGETMKAEVVRIVDFGAFVRLNANTEGLVHISEIAPFRIDRVGDYLMEKQIVPVKIVKIDDSGKIGLSIKEIDPNFAKKRN